MASESKHEYEAGKIVPMVGGTPRHSLATANMIFCLNLGIKTNGKDCRVFSSDAIIKSDKANSFLYPDASVVCGDIEYGDERKMSISNPMLIVEVMSKSILGYDRGEKFHKYATLPSFKEYILIDPDKPLVDTLYREDASYWKMMSYIGLDKEVILHSLGFSIPMKDIYDKVDGLKEVNLAFDF